MRLKKAYQIRETFVAKRGRVPECLNDLKIVIELMKGEGITDHRLCVDMSGSMDTVYHEYVVDSLDYYFGWERGVYLFPDEQTTALINKINGETVSGDRQIYEIILEG